MFAYGDTEWPGIAKLNEECGEVIQIIGRCTRDSPNKTHAQFTNLIAQPDAADEDVKVAVNNMLKAITAVGNDLVWHSSTACPTLLIAEMTVSGS